MFEHKLTSEQVDKWPVEEFYDSAWIPREGMGEYETLLRFAEAYAAYAEEIQREAPTTGEGMSEADLRDLEEHPGAMPGAITKLATEIRQLHRERDELKRQLAEAKDITPRQRATNLPRCPQCLSDSMIGNLVPCSHSWHNAVK